MSLPAIIEWGMLYVKDYTSEQYSAALSKAFVDEGFDFIILDSFPHGQRFRAACVAYAMALELVYHERTDSDGQSDVSAFALTPAGRVWLGLGALPETHDASGQNTN